MNTSLWRAPFVRHPRIETLPEAELRAYRASIDRSLVEIELLSAEERGANGVRKTARRFNRGMAGLGVAIFVGGLTAPVDGGALFWLIASGSLSQVGGMRVLDDGRALRAGESRLAMLESNATILEGEVRRIEQRWRALGL